MGALVLQYHPVDDSFNATLLEATVDALTAAGAAPRVLRIENTVGAESMRMRLTPDDLVGVDHLVVVYPTWWGALPARLLQVMTDLLGDVVDGERDHASSPLRDVRRLTVVTTHGSSRLINRLQGEPGLMLWKHTVVPLCAPGCVFSWRALYGMDRGGDPVRATFITELADGWPAASSTPHTTV